MSSQAHRRALDALCAQLPFLLDAYDEANAAFAAMRAASAGTGVAHRSAAKTVDLWTYAYVLRYYHTKFLREESMGITDIDALVEKAFMRARQNYGRVEDPARFAAWVSKICRNTFLNFLRGSSRRTTTLDEDVHLEPSPPEAAEHLDRAVIRHTLSGAIGRLPPSLQEVARRRLLQREAYDAIAETTGRPLASVRTYVNKALTRLREDPAVRALWDEW
ncbi:MAG: sigma-70 family RNA polymerase sigma factor [Bacteroidota bacterium]